MIQKDKFSHFYTQLHFYWVKIIFSMNPRNSLCLFFRHGVFNNRVHIFLRLKLRGVCG